MPHRRVATVKPLVTSFSGKHNSKQTFVTTFDERVVFNRVDRALGTLVVAR